MTLHKFMHPKNLYKKKQPNFKDLALKYEGFRRHTRQDEAGKVHVDFKDPKALKALTWVLLKDDFDLDVDLPLDRLIPTVPLRLNYVLWLKDIVGKRKSVRGIDIGCGASCIYPLLGAKTNHWSFLAVEADGVNVQYAKRNIEKNGLTDKIQVVETTNEGEIFTGLQDGVSYDFSMCNPPFFGSNLEAYAMMNTRNSERPEPSSVSTASEAESITPGGEVEFVKKMIEESVNLKDRIRVFTTMLGKKSSVGVLKEALRKRGIKQVGSYEFCQGRTMRWGLGWSFDRSVHFPKSPFQLSKTPEKGPLTLPIDRDQVSEYGIQPLGAWLLQLLDEFRLKHQVIMNCEAMWSCTVTAHENTWLHQRRKRRAEQRAEASTQRHSVDVNDNSTRARKTLSSSEDVAEETEAITEATRSEKIVRVEADFGLNKANINASCTNVDSEKSVTCPSETVLESSDELKSASDERTNCELVDNSSSKKEKSKLPLFCAWFTFKYESDDTTIYLEIKWLKGESREALHQVLQLIKNRLSIFRKSDSVTKIAS